MSLPIPTSRTKKSPLILPTSYSPYHVPSCEIYFTRSQSTNSWAHISAFKMNHALWKNKIDWRMLFTGEALTRIMMSYGLRCHFRDGAKHDHICSIRCIHAWIPCWTLSFSRASLCITWGYIGTYSVGGHVGLWGLKKQQKTKSKLRERCQNWRKHPCFLLLLVSCWCFVLWPISEMRWKVYDTTDRRHSDSHEISVRAMAPFNLMFMLL